MIMITSSVLIFVMTVLIFVKFKKRTVFVFIGFCRVVQGPTKSGPNRPESEVLNRPEKAQ